MPPDDGAAGATSVTTLLAEVRLGNREAESALAALVYGELRRLAAAYMRREQGNHTLQPTALVHEAWGRLAKGPDVVWENRAHFFATAALHMRQLLVDHARKRKAAKRGGLQQQITLTGLPFGEQHNLVNVLVLNEALDRLGALDRRACRIVELHFFGGLSFTEIGSLLGISERTVKRDWAMARAWLRKELAASP